MIVLIAMYVATDTLQIVCMKNTEQLIYSTSKFAHKFSHYEQFTSFFDILFMTVSYQYKCSFKKFYRLSSYFCMKKICPGFYAPERTFMHLTDSC